MPKIPEKLRQVACRIFRRSILSDGSLSQLQSAGTGFLVAFPVQGAALVYVVTNEHVIRGAGSIVVRLRTTAGGFDDIEIDPTDWTTHPDKFDIAITEHPINYQFGFHDACYVAVEQLLPLQAIEKLGIGIGDDVFMIGRYIENDEQTNQPVARFGNVSVMPVVEEGLVNPKTESFLLDMHSRDGYSGSPVFMYRLPNNDLEVSLKAGGSVMGKPIFGLLGIHYGQYPEPIKATDKDENEITLKVRSGITLVHPAWRILELLDLDTLRQHRNVLEKSIVEHFDKNGWPPELQAEKAKRMSGDDILRVLLNKPPKQ